MKKQMLIFLLAMVFLAMVAGCATVKRAELIENRLGANELKVRIAEEKLVRSEGKQEGFAQAMSKRVDDVEKGLGATNNQLLEVAATTNSLKKELEKVEVKSDAGIKEVKADIETVKANIGKECKNLREYVQVRLNWLKRADLENAGWHFYGGDAKNLVIFFIGPFPIGKSDITKLVPQLDIAASQIKNEKLNVVEIAAFASITKSPKETQETNQILSEERGKTIKESLEARGIKLDGVIISAHGGTVRFGKPDDNQSAIVFAVLPAPSVSAAASAPAPATPAAKTQLPTKP